MAGAWRLAERDSERVGAVLQSLRSELLRFVEEYGRNSEQERRFLAGEIASEGFLSYLAAMKRVAGVTELNAGANRREMSFRLEQPNDWRAFRTIEVSFCAQEGGARGCIALTAGGESAPADEPAPPTPVTALPNRAELWRAEVDRQIYADRPITNIDGLPFNFERETDYLYGQHSRLPDYCPATLLPAGTAARATADARAAGTVSSRDSNPLVPPVPEEPLPTALLPSRAAGSGR
ncbi:MAG: hypothetical protein IT285_05985 [Bdellovibrionales bacterium]|nr:hypothetical protein [Bdellovibrionales bacterium]